MSTSSKSSRKQQFSVLLDPALIEQVMQHTDTPGDAVEDGLKLWLAQRQTPQALSSVDTLPQAPRRSPSSGPSRRRQSVVPSPQDYPPLTPTRSQTGAITPASPLQNRSLDLAPQPPSPEPGQLRKAFSRPNMPHKDQIPPRRRIDHLPIDERRSSNDDETGWLV